MQFEVRVQDNHEPHLSLAISNGNPPMMTLCHFSCGLSFSVFLIYFILDTFLKIFVPDFCSLFAAPKSFLPPFPMSFINWLKNNLVVSMMNWNSGNKALHLLSALSLMIWLHFMNRVLSGCSGNQNVLPNKDRLTYWCIADSSKLLSFHSVC